MSESPEARNAQRDLFHYAAEAETNGRTAEVALALAAIAICERLADLRRVVENAASATGRP